MMRTARLGLLLLMTSLTVFGCKKVKDRIITSDGTAVGGDIQLIDGGTVVIDSYEISTGYEEARVFLRENQGSMRGRIRSQGRSISVSTSSGTVNVPLKEVNYIIWGSGAEESASSMELAARDGWTGTGIEVTTEDLILIRASGSVVMETGSCGPQGINYYSSSTSLLPGATNGQLIMRVGETQPMAAGSTWAGESPADGELFLAVNIPDANDPTESGGAYRVNILSTPGPGAGNTVLYPARR